MDDFKKIILPLLITIAFIIFVGLLTKNDGNLSKIKPKGPENKPQQNLIDITINNNVYLKATLADTDKLRQKGLGKIQKLEESQGMLFTFPEENSSPSFWMKDMLIPIDIIWINDGKIVQIDKNVQPPDSGTPDNKLKLYKADFPVDYVLEVNGGFSEKNKIDTGASITINLPTGQ